jgi:hypothetical protein
VVGDILLVVRLIPLVAITGGFFEMFGEPTLDIFTVALVTVGITKLVTLASDATVVKFIEAD